MNDIRDAQAIASRLWSETSWWHSGGMAWQFASEADPRARVTRVWDGAWGWMYQPDVLMMQVDPAAPELARDVVDWFDATATGASPRVEVADSNEHVISALAVAWYREMVDEPFSLDLRCKASNGTADLPPGYVLRTAADVSPDDRVLAHTASWRPADLPYDQDHAPAFDADATSSFSIAKLERVQKEPLYDPECDFVVTTTSGEAAACCTVWFDPAIGAAEIEPLGVVPSHRRRGLAVALCRAAITAIAQGGGDEVVIHPRGDVAYPAPRAAYAAAGLARVNRTRTYGRDPTTS